MTFERTKFSPHGAFALAWIVTYSVISALRSDNLGTDTQNYILVFQQVSANDFLGRELEPGFALLVKLSSFLGQHEVLFFLVSISVALSLANIGRFGLGWRFAAFVYPLFMSPFFYGHTLNILRQGMAFAFIVTLVFGERRFIKELVLIFIAGSIHISGLVFGVLVMISRRVSLNAAVVVWVAGVGIGILASIDSLVVKLIYDNLTSEYYAGYVSSLHEDYKLGLRWDFLLFSTVIAFVAAFRVFYGRMKVRELIPFAASEMLLKAYLVMNGVGLCFLQMPYSDRWLNWSWSLLPYFMIGLADILYSRRYRPYFLTLQMLVSPIVCLLFLNGMWVR